MTTCIYKDKINRRFKHHHNYCELVYFYEENHLILDLENHLLL